MKKASWLLPIALLVFLIFITGVLIGRNTIGDRIIISFERSAGRNSSVSDRTTDETAGAFTENGKIDINKASIQQLTLLPDIGETLAKRIIEYRNENGSFNTVDELLFVKGIGETRLEKIRDYITVGG